MAVEEISNKKPRVNKENLQKSLQIFRFILPYKGYFITGMVFLFLSSATSLAFPEIIGRLVDAASFNQERINNIALILLGFLILQSIFSYLRILFFAQVSERGMADVRKALYNKIISLPIPFFEQRRVGELTSRITADVTQLQDTISLTLAEFFRQIAVLVIGITILFFKSVELTLLMLATFPALIIAAAFFGRFIRRLSKKTQDALANANIVVEETFQSVNIVKAFTNELYESNRYRGSIDKVVNYAIRAAKYRGVFVSFVIFALFGAIVLVLWYGAGLVADGSMTVGQLTAFIIYTIFIGGSVGGMGDVYSKIQKTIGATDRLLEILNEKSEVDRQQETTAERLIPKKIYGEIGFQNVHFNYPTRQDVEVLKSISFHLAAGQKAALVGPSGAGKSTVIQLLLGFHKPLKGNVEVDNTPIAEYDIPSLRQHMAIVPQEVILFGGTIRENIAYGDISATDEAIKEAAKKANALDFIQSFPEGMDTVVGERGIKLSGGQKQRIAIARAILKDPSILILDEATSSLDAESEKLVQDALEELMKGRTTIIIAHRLSTVKKVDKIFVLNHGRIIESGTHEELLIRDEGLYANLMRLQFDLES